MYLIKRGCRFLRIINGIYTYWTDDVREATTFTIDEINRIASKQLVEIVPFEKVK